MGLSNWFKTTPAKVGAAGFAASFLLTAAFIAPHEGLRLKAYPDATGIPTICYGATQILGREVKLGDVATPQDCEAHLERDVRAALAAVDRLVKVPLPETRRLALGSFVYNVGEGRFAKSTLLKKLNRGDTIGACHELTRYIYAGGEKLPGLVKRRAAERDMCLRGTR